MLERRDFLKQLTMCGAAAAMPVPFSFGHSPTSRMPFQEHGDGLFTVSHRQILRSKSPRRIIIPDVGDYKVLKGDFHVHTVFSDGVTMPKERVTEAVDNGFDVISITDHIEYRPNFGGNSIKLLDKNNDHNMAYDLAKQEAEKQGIILVQGTEITKNMPPGHFNALFIKDANAIAAVVQDWKRMLAIASDQGGFIQWNHPDFPDLKPGEPMRFWKEHEDVYKSGHLHGIEIFNGYSYYPIVMQWCEEMKLAMISNSDIHTTEWDMYGNQNRNRPMTLVLAKERTYDSIKEAFFARRTIGFGAGLLFGSQEWLEKLFNACVTIESKLGQLELTNKSDIPCILQAGGAVRELPAQGRLSLHHGGGIKKLTVGNWLVGMNRPLEIELT